MKSRKNRTTACVVKDKKRPLQVKARFWNIDVPAFIHKQKCKSIIIFNVAGRRLACIPAKRLKKGKMVLTTILNPCFDARIFLNATSVGLGIIPLYPGFDVSVVKQSANGGI